MRKEGENNRARLGNQVSFRAFAWPGRAFPALTGEQCSMGTYLCMEKCCVPL